jgi:hypothetical protein
MAKKDSDTIFREYLAELEAINPGIKDILADEKVSAKLKEGVLARSEFSQKMDTLKAEREAFSGEVTEARQKITGWQNWYGQVSQEVSALQNKYQKYVDTYGELTDDGQRAAAKAGISEAEFQKRLDAEIQKNNLVNLKFAEDLTDIKMDYRDRFKAPLKTEDVYKIAGEKGVSLTAAYNEYISERVETQREEATAAKIKSEREEAVREYASAHGLPVVPNQSDMVHVLDAKDTLANPADRVRAAVASFVTSRK